MNTNAGTGGRGASEGVEEEIGLGLDIEEEGQQQQQQAGSSSAQSPGVQGQMAASSSSASTPGAQLPPVNVVVRGPATNTRMDPSTAISRAESAGARNRSPTPPRALFRSTTGKGVAFTQEDIDFLMKFLKYRECVLLPPSTPSTVN